MNAFYVDRAKQSAIVLHKIKIYNKNIAFEFEFDKVTNGQTLVLNKKTMKICELIDLQQVNHYLFCEAIEFGCDLCLKTMMYFLVLL